VVGYIVKQVYLVILSYFITMLAINFMFNAVIVQTSSTLCVTELFDYVSIVMHACCSIVTR